MKCQRKASPYSACFASRSWARFSPTTSTPASARAAISSTETYLVAATSVTSGPISARIRSRLRRIVSGDNRDDSLDAARLPVAPVREEEVGVAGRAQVDPLDLRDARRPQCSLAARPEIEHPAPHDVGSEADAERLGHLLSHLVAAR